MAVLIGLAANISVHIHMDVRGLSGIQRAMLLSLYA